MPSIRQLITSVTDGRIRIPAFQRGFVWDAERVAQLMDSIYKGYPFGSLLFWRTKNELRTERDLGPFSLPVRPADYPVDYVLDGQQRLTSIFGVFQTELQPNQSADWTNVYFDFRAGADAQESQFLALAPEEVDEVRHFPLNVLFDPSRYGSAFRSLPSDAVDVIDDLHSRFKETDIPVQTFATDDRTGVAIVFERVNRFGVALDTLQLLSAWTWSDDFDLQRKFEQLSDELAPFGFADVGEDVTLLLRTCAAVLVGDASSNAIVQMNGTTVREKFPLVVNGLKGAIDFVRRELHVEKLTNLPYASLLVPLSVFFASADSESISVTDVQRRQILRWIWKTSFAVRYGRHITPNLEADIEQMTRLKTGLPSRLDDISVDVGAQLFTKTRFNLSAVISKAFIMMLAQQHPKSLVSGQVIDLKKVLRSYNRNEFHHLYPQAYLKSRKIASDQHSALANICFINSIDNKILGGIAPSAYRSRLVSHNLSDVLRLALCPEPELFADDYGRFVKIRAEVLAAEAKRLIKL